MQRGRKKSPGRRSETLGGNIDKMLRELESRLIAITSASRGTLSRKSIEEIEKIIDEYYERWEQWA